jgi:beta-phosphoglucomutase family hydrolase
VTIKALIFDCDGTLADTMPAHFIAWRQTLNQYGLQMSEDRFYDLGGTPSEEIIAMLAEEQDVSLDPAAVALEKELSFLESIHEIGPVAPVLQVAQEFHGKMPMAVATGAVRMVLDKILRQIDLHEHFDAIVTADDVENGKPSPDVFLEAARRLGIDPAECRVYEDADPGVEAARRAGMECIDVRDFFTPRRITA